MKETMNRDTYGDPFVYDTVKEEISEELTTSEIACHSPAALRIQIDGTNTLNKGAELMYVAVVEEIERRCPGAVVYYNPNQLKERRPDLQTGVEVRKRWGLRLGHYPAAVLKRLKLPCSYFTFQHPASGINLVLDAGGFQFGDQWEFSEKRLERLENYYRKLSRQGARLVFLPQALGPFSRPQGKRTVRIVNSNAHMIIARDPSSREHFLEAGGSREKTFLYPDFTLLVEGVFPQQWEDLRGKVCIIPNRKMVTHTSAGAPEYLTFLENIITAVEAEGQEVFLLNHEGNGDLELCRRLNTNLGNRIPVVSGLGAREVKGLIGASRMVISSRYHGVASALNQGVPCLATSWSHKYGSLFEDFGLRGHLLDPRDLGGTRESIRRLLHPEEHRKIRQGLLARKKGLEMQVREMWDRIWGLAEGTS